MSKVRWAAWLDVKPGARSERGPAVSSQARLSGGVCAERRAVRGLGGRAHVTGTHARGAHPAAPRAPRGSRRSQASSPDGASPHGVGGSHAVASLAYLHGVQKLKGAPPRGPPTGGSPGEWGAGGREGRHVAVPAARSPAGTLRLHAVCEAARG